MIFISIWYKWMRISAGLCFYQFFIVIRMDMVYTMMIWWKGYLCLIWAFSGYMLVIKIYSLMNVSMFFHSFIYFTHYIHPPKEWIVSTKLFITQVTPYLFGGLRAFIGGILIDDSWVVYLGKPLIEVPPQWYMNIFELYMGGVLECIFIMIYDNNYKLSIVLLIVCISFFTINFSIIW